MDYRMLAGRRRVPLELERVPPRDCLAALEPFIRPAALFFSQLKHVDHASTSSSCVALGKVAKFSIMALMSAGVFEWS